VYGRSRRHDYNSKGRHSAPGRGAVSKTQGGVNLITWGKVSGRGRKGKLAGQFSGQIGDTAAIHKT